MDLVLLILLIIALLCVAGALWLSPLVWWILVIIAIIALIRLFMTRRA